MALSLVVTFTVPQEKSEQFLEVFKKAAQGSRKQEGCIKYDLNADINIEGVSQVRENTYTLLEQWKDEQALKFHFTTEHFKQLGKSRKQLGVDVVLRVHKKIA